MITVAETGTFQRKANQLLSEEEKSDLIAYLSENPQSGVLIQNTGGIRKLRWARSGGGKSGGVRVICYFHSEIMPLYLLTVFGKNEKANISMKEKQVLSRLVKELVSFWS
ncbi:RelE toxin of RelEB toxin-antitoxin system [Thiogranum longum]|uniref:RelE toxin of RelEB toxin-antitoxin system n=1 Tax=Thiogranum longum TaxID=1537524 RepID=A0A4R1H8S7_9GAMM|nr:type II toxin-antitoxin system RelE/ParE family toxin [Thiogranum longum]TCK17658.1 RelE toxin of RelEB toxin-antitoxin system [Thiogranum longum]